MHTYMIDIYGFDTLEILDKRSNAFSDVMSVHGVSVSCGSIRENNGSLTATLTFDIFTGETLAVLKTVSFVYDRSGDQMRVRIVGRRKRTYQN